MSEQTLPINAYKGPKRLMAATHVPGLEPQNIRSEVNGRRNLSLPRGRSKSGDHRRHDSQRNNRNPCS